MKNIYQQHGKKVLSLLMEYLITKKNFGRILPLVASFKDEVTRSEGAFSGVVTLTPTGKSHFGEANRVWFASSEQ